MANIYCHLRRDDYLLCDVMRDIVFELTYIFG